MALHDILIINIFSALIIYIIIVYYLKNGDRGERHTRLFLGMLWVIMTLLALDTMGRFDGNPDSFYPVLNVLGNALSFALAPVLPFLWILYLHNYLFPDTKPGKRYYVPLVLVCGLNGILVIATQFNGWLYYIDGENIYHRGPMYFLLPLLTSALLLASGIFVIQNRSKLERSHVVPFLVFPLAPLVGMLIAGIWYGIPFVMMGLVISILTLALAGQSIETNVDFLSGAYNRKRLELYLRKKIAASNQTLTFSAIMADVNGLKTINDTFGHTVGDEVLITISSLIRNILRSSDFVARYGGDEFCIILDTSNPDTLKTVVGKIERQLKSYNEMSLKPYTLGLSMGYAVYDPESRMGAKEFYNLIDAMMYENKKAHHEANPA